MSKIYFLVPTFLIIEFLFQYWLAGTKNCSEARCPIAFNNRLFEVGAFGNSSDICFASANIDSDNSVLRKGLCALPVAMSPRTPLPPYQRCPEKFPGDEGWPFPNYTWPADAASGETSTQVSFLPLSIELQKIKVVVATKENTFLSASKLSSRF